MAEVTGLRSNALPYPVYGAPYGVTFPILDADGDLVTGAAGLDAEISKNGDTFADCTNEGTEIATSSGMYYLLLTATELTCDVATIIQKTSTSGAKTTPLVLYPRKLVTVRSGTVGANAADGTTIQLDSGASGLDDYYNGCLVVGTLDGTVEARIIGDYVGSTKVCTVAGPAFTISPDNNDTFVIYLPEGKQLYDDNTLYWNQLTTVALPLVPTTAGRTLDVTATGAAGIDWGNLENPTTTVGLSGTTVKTATDVETDTQDIQSRLPAALTAGGNMKADALALSGDTVAADNAESFFDGTGYAGTNNVIPLVTAVTTVNGLAANVITATAIATNAIDADALAADAVTEIQAGLATSAALATVQADTDDIQTRLPAALVSGRIDASVGAMAANTLTASALATDAVTEIVAAVFARAFAAKYGSFTFEQLVGLIASTQAAKTSGAGTGTFTIRDLADGADVVVATTVGGNRTAVTVTP